MLSIYAPHSIIIQFKYQNVRQKYCFCSNLTNLMHILCHFVKNLHIFYAKECKIDRKTESHQQIQPRVEKNNDRISIGQCRTLGQPHLPL